MIYFIHVVILRCKSTLLTCKTSITLEVLTCYVVLQVPYLQNDPVRVVIQYYDDECVSIVTDRDIRLMMSVFP